MDSSWFWNKPGRRRRAIRKCKEFLKEIRMGVGAKDPFDAEGNLILTPAEIDQVLERYDQTPVPLQRQIVAAFLMQLQAAKEKIKELEALLVKEGPLNSEDMRLDDLLAILEQWKSVASGKTCVSFVNICYGASSLWHQTHMDNFRAVDRHPKELSEWVLNHVGHVSSFHFPEQVLEILKKLAEENARLKEVLEAASLLVHGLDTCPENIPSNVFERLEAAIVKARKQGSGQ